jgi:peroxiredoxin
VEMQSSSGGYSKLRIESLYQTGSPPQIVAEAAWLSNISFALIPGFSRITVGCVLLLACLGAAVAPASHPLLDLAGKKVDPFSNQRLKGVVLIFISVECPICARYAPEIQRLQREFGPRGLAFWLVQPDGTETVPATREYIKEYGYSFGLIRDPDQFLVRKAGARITPEAAIFQPNGTLYYRGRIDNRFADYGLARPEATEHDLRSALENLLAGKPITTSTNRAVGCFIPAPKNG